MPSTPPPGAGARAGAAPRPVAAVPPGAPRRPGLRLAVPGPPGTRLAGALPGPTDDRTAPPTPPADLAPAVAHAAAVPGELAHRRPAQPSVSVVICAYTLDRWALLDQAVTSVQRQRRRPDEVIVCIDHNDELLARARERWEDAAVPVPVQVVANRYDGHLGSARNTGVEHASGDIVAFLDDDAAASEDWLAALLAPYEDPTVVAVGGAPLPRFGAGRPRWFPEGFQWVFGCAYRGLPTTRAPIAHLIGASMSVRRRALVEIGGFHSDDHDDMDLSHRVAHGRPGEQILYEPAAVVSHFVPAHRVTWGYFWRRCFRVNRGKVAAFASMGDAANLRAELAFVARTLTLGSLADLRDVARGDPFGLVRLGAAVAGIALAGAGNLAGRLDLARRRVGRHRGPGRGPRRATPGSAPGTAAAPGAGTGAATP